MTPRLLLLLLTTACTPPGPKEEPGETGIPEDTSPKDDTGPDTDPPDPPDLEVSVAAQAVFDPILGGPIDVTVTATDGTPLTWVEDASGRVVVATLGPTWDGRDEAGAWVSAGPYRIVAEVTRGEERAEDVLDVHVVRCGVVAAWAEDDDGTSATRVPLYWHGSRSVQDEGISFTAMERLEDETEAPAILPPVTSELAMEPEGAAQPVAFTWDSRPILALELGEETVLGTSGLEGAGVHLEVPGWTVLSGDPLAPGAPVVIQADDLLAAGPGVLDDELTITFWAADAEGARVDLGTQGLPVRWLLMLGAPTFRETMGLDLYQPWVAAVDPALRALDGVAPDAHAVLDALVDWIFHDAGLAYDTRYGASYYTQYMGGAWDRARFDFTSFLARRMGTTVNCTDCASIMVAYANMLGAELDYTIILQNFELNYILAIGGSSFTDCPFGPGGCGFSYHAVTTDDAAATIWDATLALDGDENPSAAPNTTLMVQSIDGDEYLYRLVERGRASYNYQAQVVLQ